MERTDGLYNNVGIKRQGLDLIINFTVKQQLIYEYTQVNRQLICEYTSIQYVHVFMYHTSLWLA